MDKRSEAMKMVFGLTYGPQKKNNRIYSWSTAKCVRYGEGFEGENHPCYWCGVPPEDMFSPYMEWCDKCNGYECPHCGKCWCNVPEDEYMALKYLRNKYCCNWINFKKGMEPKDELYVASVLVPGFREALNYCREKKGFK